MSSGAQGSSGASGSSVGKSGLQYASQRFASAAKAAATKAAVKAATAIGAFVTGRRMRPTEPSCPPPPPPRTRRATSPPVPPKAKAMPVVVPPKARPTEPAGPPPRELMQAARDEDDDDDDDDIVMEGPQDLSDLTESQREKLISLAGQWQAYDDDVLLEMVSEQLEELHSRRSDTDPTTMCHRARKQDARDRPRESAGGNVRGAGARVHKSHKRSSKVRGGRSNYKETRSQAALSGARMEPG